MGWIGKYTGVISFVLVGFFCVKGHAETCISTGNGNWGTNSTWSCEGTNRVPQCGDTIRVLSSHEVTVTAQYDFTTCGAGITMALDIAGTLSFTNGNKVRLPCNSLLSLQTGGVIRKVGSGGGSSTLISICGTDVWTAGDGTITGPLAYGGPVLPIELLSFDANVESGSTVLRWSTATEVNNDYFSVYSSRNQIDWSLEHIEQGSGDASMRRFYEVVVGPPSPGAIVFRLDQTDIDGKTTTVAYTDLHHRDADLEGVTELVYPNPAVDEVTLTLDPFWDEGELTLYSVQGVPLFSWQNVTAPQHAFNVRQLGLARGLYILSLRKDERTRQVQFVVSN